MTLRFQQFLADGVGECSYLIGDDAALVCALADPRVNADFRRDNGLRPVWHLERHGRKHYAIVVTEG